MSKLIDLTGRRFGRLTVIERSENSKSGRVQWKCICDCGTECVKLSKTLINGHTKSCGCLHDERIIEYNKTVRKKYNKYDLNSYDFGVGWTTNTNREFYFDKEDFDKIKNIAWREEKQGYIYGTYNKKQVFMHRLVLGLVNKNWTKIQVDHIKHKKYDNRKSELRIVSCVQNTANQSLNKINTSGVKGVDIDKRYGTWKARIGVNNKRIYLGSFKNFEDAVKARKEAEEKYYGEYSYDNSMKK